jgi:hypothetical protein
VNCTARVKQKKCPKNQKKEIKIEVNVVYQEWSVCVSGKKKKNLISTQKLLEPLKAINAKISLHRLKNFRANEKQIV